MEKPGTTIPTGDPPPPPRKRLERRRDDRLVAGVCSGIADHLGVDPVIVRIAAVILSFMGGAGLVAYGAAWLLIPEEGRSRSIGEHAIHERHWAPIVGIVLIASAAVALIDSWWWAGRGLGFPLLLIAGGAYLLWTRTTSPTGVRYGEMDPPTNASWTEPPAPPPPTGPPEPPARPFAPRGPRRRRHRSRLTGVVLGALFIGAGIVGLVVASGSSVHPSAVFAGGLLIVGAGLVASAWFGRAWALIPIGLLLLGGLSVSTVIRVPFQGGIGERRFAPIAAQDLCGEYHLAVGEMRLDLSDLELGRGEVRTVEATVGVGHIDLTVPHDFNVEIHGASGLGDVQLLGDVDADGGIGVDRDTTIKADLEGAPKLVIEAEVGIGQVEVHRAKA
jgi:phage shock protein PspC (stress-responsive transcriptional regulator)